MSAAGYLEAYKAEAWLEYWKRGWCLVEAMIAAAYPVLNKEQRALLFRGTDHVHFRRELRGEFFSAILLHYCPYEGCGA